MIAGTMHEGALPVPHVTAKSADLRLEGFDESTGRFITEPQGPPAPGAGPEDLGWAVTNQDIIYPLALLYTTPGTQMHGDARILNAALRAGDAVRAAQDQQGRVEFIKTDGSRWGPTFMGWTNYAWLEAYLLLRGVMDDPRRSEWERGLLLAHQGQAEELVDSRVHNIPCWKAASCMRAGQVFDRPQWCGVAEELIMKAVEAQHPDGYWPEHGGPTPLYNHIYVHALGLYYRFTGDDRVLKALERAAQFHQAFTYPDGVWVETIDGRVQYKGHVFNMGWVGFAVTATGRRLVRLLASKLGDDIERQTFQGGALASTVAHLEEVAEEPIWLERDSFEETYSDWAVVMRHGGWFGCLSAYTCPPVPSRWGQDRQSFVSLWHQRVGLVIGGGNSQEQPDWSTFVAGGRYVPVGGAVLAGGDGVVLDYGSVTCRLTLALDGDAAVLEAESRGGPAVHHLVVHTGVGDILRTGTGEEMVLGERRLHLDAGRLGGRLEWKGFALDVPDRAEFVWPTVPFNNYAIDGAAPRGSEKGLLRVRLDDGQAVRVRSAECGVGSPDGAG